MATAANEGSPYGGGGGGAGGKFRKRPYRRPQTTPYDRPPTALRNPSTTINNNNGWLAKLVDPASKLITASAHRFFSSVFRKRLPPPPQPPQPLAEANNESWDNLLEAVPTNPPGAQERTINEGDNPSNDSDSSGITELEQILKQKTFSRSEIDRLTALLHSRTVDIPFQNEEKKSEANPSSELVAAPGRQEELANSPVKENGIESHRFLGVTSTPIVSSRVLEEDVASPAELAKAYMGSRPSKVSPSMLGLRSQTFRDDSPSLSNLPFPSKSPIMSLVTKSSVHGGVPENGFITPRSRGRSAIYSMARTPYSRIHPTTSHKGSGPTIDAYGGPSLSQFTLEQNRLSGSKQMALKRRSSVLDNDIGSVGPIRRIRQKPNLLSSKNLSLPVSGSPLSITGSGVVSKSRTENVDNSIPGTSFAPVPSQSSEMAQKILQQLDKLVPSPKEKSSEIKLATAREKSASRLTLDMLSGQALRSMENVDSSKFLENVQDSNKLDGALHSSLPDARDSTSQKQDKVEENGPTKLMDLRDRMAPAVNGVDTTVLNKDIARPVKTADSAFTRPVAHPPQKKRAFQMSAHEEFLELDDGGYSNGAVSTTWTEGRENLDTPLVESKTVAAEAVTVEKPPALPAVKPPTSSISSKRTDLETSDGSVVSEKGTGFTFPVAPAASMTIQPAVLASQSISTFDKVIPSKEPNAAPIFSFSSKNGDKVPPFTFSSSSSVVSESSGLKSGAWSDTKLESSSGFDTVGASATDAVPKVPESDKGDNENPQNAGSLFRKQETAFPSAVSTSMSTTSIFSFGAPANNPSLNNGSLASSPSTFSSPTPILNFNNVTTQKFSNISTVTATTTAKTDTSSSSNLSTLAAVPSFPAAPIFKFGSSILPSTSVSPLSATSVVESTDTQVKNKQEPIFANLSSTPFGGISSSIAGTGSGFGFSPSTVNNQPQSSTTFGTGSSAPATSTVNNQPQSSTPFGTGSESLVSARASPAGTGVANFTQSIPIQFGSSASSPSFGLSGNVGTTTFASGSSQFDSSTSSTNLFSSVPSFGPSSSSSSSEANSISSSSGTTSSLFGSSWQQPGKSPIFGSTFNSTAPSTGFSFGGSSASVAANNSTPMVFGSSTAASMGSTFSFTSASANTSPSTSLSPSQPVFGNPNSVFAFGSASGNNDQMNMEDSMAEDSIQSSTPAVPIFNQPSISPPSGFMFGSTASSGVNPFQFGSQQQNPAMPQNPSLFQSSGSLDFNAAGGSFSLGTGGSDKSGRKMIKVSRKPRKK